MKIKSVVPMLTALLLSGGVQSSSVDTVGEVLVKKDGCTMCHQLDKKGIGPSFMDISKKYQGYSAPFNIFVDALQFGSKNKWGKMPMGQQSITEADAYAIAFYVVNLAGTPIPIFPTAADMISSPLVQTTLPTSPSQCATYDPARNPQVQIPCVQIRDGVVYAAGLNQVPTPTGLRFVVEPSSIRQINVTPNETCSVLPVDSINRLYIACLDLGINKPWVMLDLSNSDPLTFDFVDYGNPSP